MEPRASGGRQTQILLPTTGCVTRAAHGSSEPLCPQTETLRVASAFVCMTVKWDNISKAQVQAVTAIQWGRGFGEGEAYLQGEKMGAVDRE